MAKHVKILEGHSIKEWESKFQKKIEKGKLKTFNSEKDLMDFATYWKINNKYYQVPTFFEWYNKSLRKSVGLTVALTTTSVLATFFLCAALIQSQIKWNDDQGCTVSLYANDGAFADGSKSKVVSGIKRGTKLKEIGDYAAKYIPSKPSSGTEDYAFDKWYVDDGKDITVFHDDDAINDNISLKANYEMVPSIPDDFKTDSWATVYSVIEQGKDVFIDTYCKEQLSHTNDREEALLKFMDSLDNWKIVSVGNIGEYGVRLIGIGQDELYEEPTNEDTHELFTFEFNECIAHTSYTYGQSGSPFYTKDGSTNPEEETHDFCLLHAYNNSDLFTQLPTFIRERIQTVKKRTLQIHNGFKCTPVQTLQSWVFDPKCLDGSGDDSENKLEIVETPEKLFSLSIDEIGRGTIDFDIGEEDKGGGKELMKDTIHANEKWLGGDGGKKVLDSIGEGFKKDDQHYTEPYMFYQKEWSKEEGDKHTDSKKRAKRYFMGDDTEGTNTQYRLRSMYIPNNMDKDGENVGGSNKDYRCFETFNIGESGEIGVLRTGINAGEQFIAGDMAWAGIYVAPAFCL